MSLQYYIHSLIDNMNTENIPEEIDLILDGGAFNGAYLLGSVLYLQEMEKKKMIKINRISGCSAGAACAFLYLTDQLDKGCELYDKIISCWRDQCNLSMYQDYIRGFITDNIEKDTYKKLNNKLYISYFDINEGKQMVISTYKNNDDVIEALLKTSYLPLLTDGDLLYKESCLDGVYPYIFRNSETRMLFINLFSIKKIPTLFSLKNEKNIYSRLLSGIVDINTFFCHSKSTDMCSYINDWNIFDFWTIRMRDALWTILMTLIRFSLIIKKYLPETFKKTIVYMKCASLSKSFYVDVIQYLCF